MTDTEKTLLQMIRDKEQEYARQIENTTSETAQWVTTARTEAEDLLCSAEKTGKAHAEEVYWTERGKIEAEIEALKKAAERDQAAAIQIMEQNVQKAAERIVRYVTME